MTRLAFIVSAVALCAACAALTGPVLAGSATGTKQSTYLYTAPDTAAGGGIHGRIVQPAKPVVDVFAQASDDWKRVYRAQLSADRTEFRFTGLPVGLYDLVVLYPDRFVEGLYLTRDDSTLTEKDRSLIEAAIMKSTPFFNEKKIHRCEGITGSAGKARCVLQEVRTRPITLQSAEVRSDIQVRSLKLALVEDVGIGWSVVNTREIVRQEVQAGDVKGLLSHGFAEELGGIRVIDKIKELGELTLRQ